MRAHHPSCPPEFRIPLSSCLLLVSFFILAITGCQTKTEKNHSAEQKPSTSAKSAEEDQDPFHYVQEEGSLFFVSADYIFAYAISKHGFQLISLSSYDLEKRVSPKVKNQFNMTIDDRIFPILGKSDYSWQMPHISDIEFYEDIGVEDCMCVHAIDGNADRRYDLFGPKAYFNADTRPYNREVLYVALDADSIGLANGWRGPIKHLTPKKKTFLYAQGVPVEIRRQQMVNEFGEQKLKLVSSDKVFLPPAGLMRWDAICLGWNGVLAYATDRHLTVKTTDYPYLLRLTKQG